MIYDEPVGVIRDHSNGIEYRPNSDCSFLIEIAGAPYSTVSLVFSRFQLEDFYDYIIIYDGDNERKQDIFVLFIYQVAPILTHATGSFLPSPIRSSSNKLLVTFVSDSTGQFSGFYGSYSSTCICLQVIF